MNWKKLSPYIAVTIVILLFLFFSHVYDLSKKNTVAVQFYIDGNNISSMHLTEVKNPVLFTHVGKYAVNYAVIESRVDRGAGMPFAENHYVELSGNGQYNTLITSDFDLSPRETVSITVKIYDSNGDQTDRRRKTLQIGD